jgi:hypothetical protein
METTQVNVLSVMRDYCVFGDTYADFITINVLTNLIVGLSTTYINII